MMVERVDFIYKVLDMPACIYVILDNYFSYKIEKKIWLNFQKNKKITKKEEVIMH